MHTATLFVAFVDDEKIVRVLPIVPILRASACNLKQWVFTTKQMFYTLRVQSQIDRLAELLQPEKFTLRRNVLLPNPAGRLC